jgi:hypothetical protein
MQIAHGHGRIENPSYKKNHANAFLSNSRLLGIAVAGFSFPSISRGMYPR